MSAEKVYDIIKDYQCDYTGRKFDLTAEHIQIWADQFGEDSEFVLKEMAHLLPTIYISKEKARHLLKTALIEFQGHFKYKTMHEFITNAFFFDTQKREKSQKEILQLMDEILSQDFMIDYHSLKEHPKKHYLYFDDILATGGTIFRDLKAWLKQSTNGTTNFKQVINKNITLSVNLFCCHSLGYSNLEYMLMKNTEDAIKKHLIFRADYVIENNLKTKWIADQQKLNCAYPIDNQSKKVIDYFNRLSADHTKVPAFRTKNQPQKEVFFSSPENRVRLENIFLEKGIELLSKIKSEHPDPRKRPLGDTVASHKTLGTGTLYFTWRNISNTCPLVFWWDVPGHDWTPLFCVKNRGV